MGVYPNQATQYDIFVTSILLRYRVGPLEKTKLTVKISQKNAVLLLLIFQRLTSTSLLGVAYLGAYVT